MAPAFADAVAQRAVEVGAGPAADAVVLVGRDVAGIDGPERRLERQASGPGRAAFGGVAGVAVRRHRDIGAALGQCLHLIGAERLVDILCHHAFFEQADKNASRNDRGQNGECDHAPQQPA